MRRVPAEDTKMAGAIIQDMERQALIDNELIPTARPHSPPNYLARIVQRASVAMVLNQCCESPIEVFLGVECVIQLHPVLNDYGIQLVVPVLGEKHDHDALLFVPQYEWGRYRIDWAFERYQKALLFLECDGKEFHSTADQIARDYRKDTEATKAGIPLLRFSGSEIFKYPDGCVHRVLEYLVRYCGAV